MEKKVYKLTHITVHILIWLGAILLYFAIPKELHNNFIMMYGIWGAVVVILATVAVFLSVAYVPLIFKKNAPIINILITTILSVLFFRAFIAFDQIDAKFSTENWAKYPESRASMYDDLLSHDIVGLSERQVVDLMGEPDSITENGDYKYNGGAHYFVYISFENGSAIPFLPYGVFIEF